MQALMPFLEGPRRETFKACPVANLHMIFTISRLSLTFIKQEARSDMDSFYLSKYFSPPSALSGLEDAFMVCTCAVCTSLPLVFFLLTSIFHLKVYLDFLGNMKKHCSYGLLLAYCSLSSLWSSISGATSQQPGYIKRPSHVSTRRLASFILNKGLLGSHSSSS